MKSNHDLCIVSRAELGYGPARRNDAQALQDGRRPSMEHYKYIVKLSFTANPLESFAFLLLTLQDHNSHLA